MTAANNSGSRYKRAAGVVALLAVGLVVGWLVLRNQAQTPETIPTTPQVAVVAPLPTTVAIPEVEVAAEVMAPSPLQDHLAPVKRKLPTSKVSGKENPELISFEHAAFFDLQHLARSMEMTRPLKLSDVLFRIQTMTGVNEQTAVKLLAYVQDARRNVDAMMKQVLVDTCANRSQLHSIRVIADRMDKDDERVEARRVELVRGAQAIIGPDGMQRLRQHIDTNVKPGMTQLVGDTEAMLIALNKPPEEVVAMICRVPQG